MAAPTECEITSPTDGMTVGAGPAGAATIDCAAESDAEAGATPQIDFRFGGVSEDIGATDGSGNRSAALDFPAGTTALTARAVNADGNFTSTAVNVTVVDMAAGVAQASDRTVQWYLNFLAGNTVYNIPSPLLPSMRSAACAWAGISEANYGTIAALNIKAGITDPGLYVSVNKALNLIAYGTLNSDECQPWLTDQGALFKIMQEL